MLATLIAPTLAQAQVGTIWSFDQLRDKADVVVIAECERVVDTGRTTAHPDLKPFLPVFEMRSTFRVQSVLKGGSNALLSDSTFELLHYRLDVQRAQQPKHPGEPPLGIVNGGAYLELQPHSTYLLFLSRRPDGAFEPLTGHARPQDAVFLLKPADI